MTISMKKTGLAAVAATALLAIASPAFAQDAGVSAETQYILNTFSFLFSGALVMWMAAGFAMLESGLVRTKIAPSVQKHRSVLCCRYHVLPDRLQPDVYGRYRLDRFAQPLER